MPEGPEIARCVERVIEHIPAVAKRLGIDANGGWTLLIKDQLAQLGDELDYDVCASGAAWPDADRHPDWLYDLTWLKRASGGTEVARVPLVLESEWHSNRDEQRDDFQELLSAPADLHVLVFQQRKAAAVQAVMDELERQAKACEAAGRGELCMLCGYDWEDTQRFAFRTFAT